MLRAARYDAGPSAQTAERSWPWFGAGYLALAGFVALEAVVRAPGEAGSLEASADDATTTRAIVAAYALSATAAPLLRPIRQPGLPGLVAPVGAATAVAGLALRAWSMVTLGEAYSRTLRTSGGQALVEDGPYRWLRHPGYLGSLLVWTGFALTSRSPAVLAWVASLVGSAYRRRILTEEALLDCRLPGYAAYRTRTWRLVPFVW